MAESPSMPTPSAYARQPGPSLRQPSRVLCHAVKLGALVGMVPGAALGLTLLLVGGPPAVVLLVAVLVGAAAGIVEGLLAGCALIACGRIVRRSPLMARLVSGVAVSAVPVVAIVVWLAPQVAPGAGANSFFVTVCAVNFVAGAVLGPRAVAEKGYWSVR
jgi:hypothetical protein